MTKYYWGTKKSKERKGTWQGWIKVVDGIIEEHICLVGWSGTHYPPSRDKSGIAFVWDADWNIREVSKEGWQVMCSLSVS